MTPMLKLIENKRKIIIFIFFLGLLIIGLNIFKDYGVHWDEFNNQNFGERCVEYIEDFISEGPFTYPVPLLIPESQQFSHDWIHGPAFEIFLMVIYQKLLHFIDSRDIILTRHLLTFLLFYAAVFFFYRLCQFHFKSWKVAILGSLFLILHPRIFAHSFYNSVDIPFLSFYIISTYALLRYLDKKTSLRAVFHALACALLFDIRVIGVVLPLCTFIFLCIDLIKSRGQRAEVNKIIKTTIVYAALLIVFIVFFSPLLWKNPISNFLTVFEASTKFYRQDMPISPWYYNLKWIIVTTPLLYSLCFFAGLFISIKALLRNPVKHYLENRTLLIAMLLFFIPLIYSIVYQKTLYDDWRHYYFIYPFFIIFSLTGLMAFFKFIKLKLHGLSYKIINTAFIFIIVSSLINTLWFMVKHHPYQCVYANILAGRDMRHAKVRSALEYWGLSYRKALEYVLKNDESEIIKVCVANAPGLFNAMILPQGDRKRLTYVKKQDEADYFLGNYESFGECQWDKGEYPQEEEYYSLKISKVKFMVVYKLK